jgi:DNA-binding response OmpR family regulator
MSTQCIVLAEDDDQLRTILARTLRHRGHTVREARTGAEARALLAEEPADLVVLDVNLPDETGWSLLRWLRAQRVPMPRVIIITAARPARSRVLNLKPDAVLTKPFPVDALIRLAEQRNGTR